MAKGKSKAGESAGSKLKRMKRAIAESAMPFAQLGAVQILGNLGFELASESVASASNPAGRKWAPLAAIPIKGGRSRERDSHGRFAASTAPVLKAPPSEEPLRKLAGTLRLRFTAARFYVDASPSWAGFHQKGAKNREKPKWRLPARAILPKKSVPKKWAVKMTDALQKGIKDISRKLAPGGTTTSKIEI